MKYILGVDVGTSNVKAVLFDEYGKELCIKSKECKPIYGLDNHVEQDMLLVWEMVKLCIHGVMLEKADIKAGIVGIGITGQGEGCWLVDKFGEPVQNAILWCDGRAVDEVRWMTEDKPEIGQLYHSTTGTPPLLGNQMMLLKWMKNHRKEILDQADKVLFCKDWIRLKLTGEIHTELTDSITSLLNVKDETIAVDLMKTMKIEEYYPYLTEPVTSETIVGTVLDSLSEELELPKGLPVIAGALDTSATAVGLGAIHEKDVCVILGTTCASEIVMNKNDCEFGSPNSRFERHPLGDLYVSLQPTLNGTPNIDWVLEQIANTRDYNEIDRIVDSVPVGCGGVVYHPYISVAGERAPFFHPYARASFFGLSQVTKKETLIRAVYEGISLSIRDCLYNVDKSGKIFLAGGGAKSPIWAQMIADVVGMQVMISGGNELGAKGVALMVGVQQGIYEDYEEAVAKACTFKQIFIPNKGRKQKYDLLYELYKNIRQQSGELWNYRHQMNKKMRQISEEE